VQSIPATKFLHPQGLENPGVPANVGVKAPSAKHTVLHGVCTVIARDAASRETACPPKPAHYGRRRANPWDLSSMLIVTQDY
jgi:hypothetical protein